MRSTLTLSILLSLGLSSPSRAASISAIGDVVIAGATPQAVFNGPTEGKLLVFSNQGILRGELFSSVVQQAFAHPEFLPASSDFVVAAGYSTAGAIVRFDKDGNPLTTSILFPVGTKGVAVSNSGNFYVSAALNASLCDSMHPASISGARP